MVAVESRIGANFPTPKCLEDIPKSISDICLTDDYVDGQPGNQLIAESIVGECV